MGKKDDAPKRAVGNPNETINGTTGGEGHFDPFSLLEREDTLAYPFRDPDLPLEERIDNLLSVMSPGETGKFFAARGQCVARLDIGFSGQVEGYHGAALGGHAGWGSWPETRTTQFCQAIGLAATWEPELVRQAAEVEAIEFRYAYHKLGKGGLVVRAPNADMGRDIRWGRNEECYGEDPCLNGQMVAAFVKGLQGSHPRYLRTAALLKHFLANSNEDTRSHSSSDFDERLFREYYSVAFRKGFEAGADSYMAAYNAYNGIPCHVHPFIKEITIGEGWVDGIICTDGGGLGLLVSDHKYFPDLKTATAACLKAGINQYLDQLFYQGIMEAFQAGLVTKEEVASVIRGVLRIMFRLGLFDPPEQVPYTQVGDEPPWESAQHKDLVREVTRKSIVLLKNEGALLPLDAARIQKIAVIGPLAKAVHLDWYSGTPPYRVTPLEGIVEGAGKGVAVAYTAHNRDGAAAALARESDIALVFVGNHPTCYDIEWAKSPFPSEGKEALDRQTITLEPHDEALIAEVLAANPRTIVVLVASFPYAINRVQETVPAILCMTHNSQEMGHALADVLFGDFNPAGRLVQTWPRSLEQLPPLLDYDIRGGRTYMYFKEEPLYPFGFGLSYTTFAYRQLHTGSAVLTAGETLTVSVEVANTGSRDGEEVVQLYVKHLASRVSRPLKELKAFCRVMLKAGETRRVDLLLAADELRYWDSASHAWVLESGQVMLLAGGSSADGDLKLATTITVRGTDNR